MTIYIGDSLEWLRKLPSESVNCIVTSPPYFQVRDYGVDGQYGLEETPQAFVDNMVAVFREARRVLRHDGTLWLNIADTYASGEVGRHDSIQGREIDGKAVTKKLGSQDRQTRKLETGIPPKNMLLIPHRLAIALQADGWYIRSAITWCKTSPMPESVTDRPTKATEQIFLLTKNSRYWYDADAVRKVAYRLNGRNAVNKVASVSEMPPSLGFPSESGIVSSYAEFAPYFILTTFLAMEWVSVEQRNGYLNQLLNVFQFPETNRMAFFADKTIFQDATQILVNVLQDWKIVISQGNLNPQAEFWIWFARTLTNAIKSVKTSFTVKETSEVVAKFISNMKIVRQTFSLNALLEGIIDINLIDQSVTLFDCANLLTRHCSDSMITVSSQEQFSFLISDFIRDIRLRCVRHKVSPIDSVSTIDYTTKTPTTEHNLWDYWLIGSEPSGVAHFATMPLELAETCIKAGCPETVCAECGMPYVRETEKQVRVESGNRNSEGYKGLDASNRRGDYPRATISINTLGFNSTCICNGATRPGIVLDPFGGAGTTALAAIKNNRHYQLIELNPKYVEIAQQRIAAFNPYQPTTLPNGMKQLSLFQDES